MSLFKTLGLMLDLSRGGVMRVDSIKRYIDYLKALDYNMLLLYMEDVYPLDDYPMFGYMRGRYTKDELRAIDDYAAERGIEVVPCIQTLGHLEQYLRHPEARPVRGTSKELLCGEEKTYELIEAMIRTMRECFRTKRLHVGMDECEEMNGGEYRRRHGEQDVFTVFATHIKRVCAICENYDFKPIIWGDVLSGVRTKLTKEEQEALISEVPDFDIVNWKYWTINKDSLLESFENDKRWGRQLIFAGGDSTWTGHLPNYQRVNLTLLMSAQAAIESGIDEIFITSWGDDGRECNNFFGFGALLQLAEFNRTGKIPTREQLTALAESVGSMDYDTMLLGEVFNRPFENTQAEGKRILWSDVLMNSSRTFDPRLAEEFRKAAAKVQPMIDRGDEWELYYRFEKQVFETAADKCEILVSLRPAYINGDREFLRKAANELLPALHRSYKALESVHRALWAKDYKPFGWQMLSGRYGAQLLRVQYANDRLNAYLNGELAEIEELLPEPVPYTDSPVMPDVYDQFYVDRMESSNMLINMAVTI